MLGLMFKKLKEKKQFHKKYHAKARLIYVHYGSVRLIHDDSVTDSGIDASQDNGSTMDGRLSAMEDQLLPQERDDSGDDFGRKTDRKRKPDSKSHANLSRKEVDSLIDNESLKTMDGCLKILSDLNVREALLESE